MEPGLTLLSCWRGSLWTRRIPCHLPGAAVPARVVPRSSTAQQRLGEAGAVFLAQPDLAASTRRSYQQTPAAPSATSAPTSR
jgi:hypothetical protein